MNILVISKRFTSRRDCALERFGRAYEISKSLSKLDNSVKLLYIDYKKYENFRYKVSDLEVIVSSLCSLLHNLIFIMKCKKYNVIMGMSDPICGILGFIMSKILKAPFVYEIQDNYDVYGITKVPFIKNIENHIARNSDLVICASELLNKKYKDMKCKTVITVPHGIDLTNFKLINKLEARKKINLPSDKKIIVYSGSLGNNDGLDKLIESYDILKKTGNFLLVLAGNGPFRHKLKKREDIVSLNLNHSDVPYLLNSADVLVIPYPKNRLTNYCDYPLKLLEYMSVNKHIVSTNFGNIHKILDNNDLLDTERPEDLAELISKKLINNYPTNYRKIVMEYSWEIMGKKLNNILKTLDKSVVE